MRRARCGLGSRPVWDLLGLVPQGALTHGSYDTVGNDYYIVIIGNRYGTLTADGMSYTEKEYEYALSKKLKVIAFIHKSPGDLPAKHVDEDPEAKKKLIAFRERLETKRLVHFWEGSGDLAGKVATSMAKMIRMHPAVGWVRADQVASIENLTEINELRKETERLKAELTQGNRVEPIENLAGLDEPLSFQGRCHRFGDWHDWGAVVTWREIVASLGPYAMTPTPEGEVQKALCEELFPLAKINDAKFVSLSTSDFQTMKIQLLALGLIKLESGTKGGQTITLTPAGHRVLLDGRTIKTAPPKKTKSRS